MKKKGFLVGFSMPGVYPPGRDDVQADLLSTGNLRSCALADPEVKDRYDIEIINESIKSDHEGTARRIAEQRPDFVAYSTYLWNYNETVRSSELVRKLSPGTRVIFGGPQVSDLRQETMDEVPHLDLIVGGSGEVRFRQLLKNDFNPNLITEMPFVAYRKHDGTPILRDGKVKEDVSQIPSPYKTGAINLNDGKKHTVTLETFRGCPMTCQYCRWGDPDGSTQRFPLEQILGDVDVIFNNKNIEYAILTDANIFYTPEDHWRPFLERIVSSSQKIPLVTNLDMRVMKPKMIELLSKIPMGLGQYTFGMQSTNPAALAFAERTCIGDIKTMWTEGVDMIRKIDPDGKICLEIIYGLPGDNHKGFLETVDFALGLRPSKFYMFPLLVLPGTPFWEKRDMFKFDKSPSPDYMVKSNLTYSAEDMRRTFDFASWFPTMQRFPAIQEALVSSAHNGTTRVDLIQEYITRVKKSTGITPVEEFSHSLPSANRILRSIMDPMIEPQNGHSAYEIARQLVSSGNPVRADLDLGLAYYNSRRTTPVEDVDRRFIDRVGKEKLDSIKCNWFPYANSIG